MSVFNLKTSKEELSMVNDGTSQMKYEQYPPTRDVTTTNFTNGSIHIRWEVAGQKWWIPARSYLRTRVRITKGDGATALEISDDVALNMGLNAHLYQSAEFKVNGKVISRIGDYMPQIDALHQRLTKSKSWLDSIGNSANLWQASFKERQGVTASDGLELKNPQPSSEAVTSRVALGYVATATIEVKAGELEIARVGASPANDLPAASPILVNQYIRLPDGTEYKVLEVVTETVASHVFRVQGANVAAAAAVVAFERVVKQSDPGEATRRLQYLETIWQPPLSVFKLNHALPAGQYELTLNPQTSSAILKRAVESALADKNGGAGADFRFEVEQMYMYVATMNGPRADDLTYLLDLDEINCQTDNVQGTALSQRNFDVSPASYALTLAYQDLRAGNNTLYSAAKFKFGNAGNGERSEETKLERMFVQYAGESKPQPDADPGFVVGANGKDYFTQRYIETQLNSGAYYDCGGAEPIEEWRDRGSFYYLSWPRDGADRSTRVAIHQQFNGGADVSNARVLLFDHYKKTASITIQSSRVVSVDLEDQ